MNKFVKNSLLLLLSFVMAVIINYYFTSEIVSRLVYIKSSILLPFSIIFILLQALLIFSVIQLVINKTIDPITLKTLFGCYFVVLILVLFARRSFGISKYNLNPMAILHGLNSYVGFLIFVFNVVLFIPIGYLFRHKKFVTLLIVMLPVEFIIESIQYIFKVGVFDINDISLNIIGISIGYLLTKNKDLKVSGCINDKL